MLFLSVVAISMESDMENDSTDASSFEDRYSAHTVVLRTAAINIMKHIKIIINNDHYPLDTSCQVLDSRCERYVKEVKHFL